MFSLCFVLLKFLKNFFVSLRCRGGTSNIIASVLFYEVAPQTLDPIFCGRSVSLWQKVKSPKVFQEIVAIVLKGILLEIARRFTSAQ